MKLREGKGREENLYLMRVIGIEQIKCHKTTGEAEE